MKELALKYLEAGISVIPVHGDGSKSPAVASWHPFMQNLAPPEAVERWFSGPEPRGLAAICGSVSGGLLAIDFDEKEYYRQWLPRAGEAVPDLLEHVCIVESPRGFHVWLRSGETHSGTKLARVPLAGDKGGFKTVIETRGEKNYVLLPGSPKECHPDHKEYRYVDGVELTELKVMHEEDVEILLNVAKSFNEWRPPGKLRTGLEKLPKEDERPGTYYCKQGGWEEWAKLLERHGWVLLRTTTNNRQIWKRPGKRDRGGSATLGFVVTELGAELYVFSSNADPFEQDRCYSLFAARALLDFGGDYKRCTIAVADEGYGKEPDSYYQQVVEKAIDSLREKIEAGSPTLGPGYLEDALHDGRFKAIWKRRRTDFNLDNRRYEMALLGYAISFGPLENCMANAIGLLYEFHKQYEPTTERVFDRDYVARRIAYLDTNKEVKPLDTLVEDFHADERGDDWDKNINWLRTVAHPQYDGLKQYGNDVDTATYAIILLEHGEIRIGTIHDLNDSEKVADALAVNGCLRDFNGWIDPRYYKKAHWRCAKYAMLKTRVFENQDISQETRFAELLSEYLSEGTMFSEGSEEGWEAALPTGAPFRKAHRYYVKADSFNKWIGDSKNEAYKSHIVSHLLRKFGWEKERISASYRDRRLRPWYWWLEEAAMAEMLGLGGNGSEPERTPF